jgi:hypothetical protein
MQALAGPYKGEDVRDQLEERISEHSSWVDTNCAAQLAAYADFVASRTGEDTTTTVATKSATGTADKPAGTQVELPSPTGNGNGASLAEGAREATLEGESSELRLAAYGGSKPQSLVLLDELDVAEFTTELETRVKNVVRR